MGLKAASISSQFPAATAAKKRSTSAGTSILKRSAMAWANARRLRANWRTLLATTCSAVGAGSEAACRRGNRANRRSRDSVEGAVAGAGAGELIKEEPEPCPSFRFIMRRRTRSEKIRHPAANVHRPRDRRLRDPAGFGFPDCVMRRRFHPNDTTLGRSFVLNLRGTVKKIGGSGRAATTPPELSLNSTIVSRRQRSRRLVFILSFCAH